MTQVPFKGCIKDVQLGTLAKDLNENKEFKDMSPGCTEVTGHRPALMVMTQLSLLCHNITFSQI